MSDRSQIYYEESRNIARDEFIKKPLSWASTRNYVPYGDYKKPSNEVFDRLLQYHMDLQYHPITGKIRSPTDNNVLRRLTKQIMKEIDVDIKATDEQVPDIQEVSPEETTKRFMFSPMAPLAHKIRGYAYADIPKQTARNPQARNYNTEKGEDFQPKYITKLVKGRGDDVTAVHEYVHAFAAHPSPNYFEELYNIAIKGGEHEAYNVDGVYKALKFLQEMRNREISNNMITERVTSGFNKLGEQLKEEGY